MKLKAFLALLLAFVLLAGCGKKAEEPAPAPAEPSASPSPVEQTLSGLYFENRADNNFLYELNQNTMEAVPFAEKQIYNPIYHDGNVYYLNTQLQQVICMDAQTGAEVVAQENVGWFRLDGDYLLFGKLCADVSESYFSVQKLPDGEPEEIFSGNYSIPALCGGWVYYTETSEEGGTVSVCAYDCEKKQKTDVERFNAESEKVSRVYSVGDSAFYCVNDTDWHILSGGKLSEESWSAYLSEQVEPLYVDGSRMLYLFDGQCQDGIYRSRLCMQDNGAETVILEGAAEGENVVTASRLADGKWIVELHNAILNEVDGQIHHAYVYSLLTADGTLTPITGAGTEFN